MSAADSSPTIEQTTEALEALTDILIAAQELGDKWRTNGRPYLAYCARQLEDQCHSVFHEIELVGSGWAPTIPEAGNVEP